MIPATEIAQIMSDITAVAAQQTGDVQLELVLANLHLNEALKSLMGIKVRAKGVVA